MPRKEAPKKATRSAYKPTAKKVATKGKASAKKAAAAKATKATKSKAAAKPPKPKIEPKAAPGKATEPDSGELEKAMAALSHLVSDDEEEPKPKPKSKTTTKPKAKAAPKPKPKTAAKPAEKETAAPKPKSKPKPKPKAKPLPPPPPLRRTEGVSMRWKHSTDGTAVLCYGDKELGSVSRYKRGGLKVAVVGLSQKDKAKGDNHPRKAKHLRHARRIIMSARKRHGLNQS